MTTRSHSTRNSLCVGAHSRCASLLAVLAASAALSLGCAGSPLTSTRVTSDGGPDMGQARAEAYDGPKARIAIARFKNEAHSGGALSHGMEDMLATALFQSERFIVLERRQLDDVIGEQDLGETGRFDRRTTAKIGKLEGAELLVTASVTEWDPGTASGSGSLSRLPIPGANFIGSVAGNFREAHIGIDLRIVDTNTGRVVAATSVAGKSRGIGGSAGGFSFLDGVAGTASGGAKSALDSAMREVIRTAVDFIASKTPANFYRYN